MIDFIDLVEFCKLHGNKLTDVKVYGKLTEVMTEPKSLKSDVVKSDDCVCCNFDIIAVNLKSYKDELKMSGIRSVDNIYFVNGSMSVFVDKDTVMNDWYMCIGTMRLATRVKSSPVMAMYNFYKNNDTWGINKTNIYDLDVTDFNTSSGRVYEYIMRSDEVGSIILPNEVKDINKFYSDEPLLFSVGTPQESVLSGFEETWKVKNNDSGFADNHVDIGNSSELRLSCEFNRLVVASDCAKESRNNFISLLRSNFPCDTNQYLRHTINSICSKFSNAGGGYSVTGKQLIKGYLSSCGVDLEAEYLGLPLWNYLMTSMKDILKGAISGDRFESTGIAKDCISKYLSNLELIYAGVLGEITGLSTLTLVSMAKYLQSNGVSFSRIVNENTYILGIASSHLSVEEVEYLALCFGLAESGNESILGKTVSDYRNIAVLVGYFRSISQSEDYVFESDLSGKVVGSILTDKRYEDVKARGYYFSNSLCTSLGNFMTSNLGVKDWSYTDKSQWLKANYGYYRIVDSASINKAIYDASQLGVLIQFDYAGNNCVAYWHSLDKELTCYKSVKSLHEFPVDIDENLLDKYIEEFQDENGLLLNEEQLSAIKMLRTRVFAINGEVGTGVSDVVNCIKFVLSKIKVNCVLTEFSYNSIKSLSDRAICDGVFDKSGINFIGGDCVFIRDMECLSVDEIYGVIKDVAVTSRVVFVGDMSAISQPSRGAMFKSLMKTVPCMTLTSVTHKSGVSDICNSVIRNSDSSNWSCLSSSDNCVILPCENSDIPIVTSLLCKYHTDSLSDDEMQILESKTGISDLLKISKLPSRDIQVVTPVEKQSYQWGSYNMNNILRGVFNTYNKPSFVWGSANKRVSYKIGDRVIQVRNGSNYQRYSSIDNGVMQRTNKTGVSYGELGTIAGVFAASSCSFLGESSDTSSVRNDVKFTGNDKYFIAVRYYDSLSGEKFFILYRAYVDTSNTLDCVSFVGGDVDSFQLHYCGTTSRCIGHKNKLVISIVGDLGFDGFLTRNMLYSQWYNALDGLYIIGDVSNEQDSQLSRARRYISCKSNRLLGDILCK